MGSTAVEAAPDVPGRCPRECLGGAGALERGLSGDGQLGTKASGGSQPRRLLWNLVSAKYMLDIIISRVGEN